MIGIFKKVIIEQHSRIYSERIKPDDISFLLYNTRNGAVLFVFVGKKTQPLYVFKIADREREKSELTNEYESLRRLAALELPELEGTVPEVFCEGTAEGHRFILERPAYGAPLWAFVCSSRNSRTGTEKIFTKVTDWLIYLHRNASYKTSFASEACVKENIESAVSLYKKKQGMSSERENRVRVVLDGMRQLAETRIPIVIQHFDFALGNIFYNKATGRICILDWQYATFSGLPLVDLFNFFNGCGYTVSGYAAAAKSKADFTSFSKNIINPVPTEKDFINIFYEDNWRSRLVKKYVDKYCVSVGLDTRLVDYMFLVFILEHLYTNEGFLDIFLDRGKPLFI
jgi:hypothetical protein